ncbi:MAG TPA: shikimate dehydrogenase, partial [Candidatus Dormibacteraeota bacterium]|nr:shikimate dehydrogenase [Candidatus Dormibacteraeota bacterium]
MTTGASAATRLFPEWARVLDLGDVRLEGVDLPLHADPGRYHDVVERIKQDRAARGALVTTHKVDLYESCRDLFDGVDEYSRLLGETSCLAKRDDELWAFATDPISSGRALGEFYRDVPGGEVLCLGAGGAAVAITLHLMRHSTAARITVVNRSAGRLEAMRSIIDGLHPVAEMRYVENEDPGVNDHLIASLPPGSLVINATGMGKDRPGSPITDGAVFPERGYAWEINYRGELKFLHQARRQSSQRHLHVEDGWRYFIHGWAAVMERVF